MSERRIWNYDMYLLYTWSSETWWPLNIHFIFNWNSYSTSQQQQKNKCPYKFEIPKIFGNLLLIFVCLQTREQKVWSIDTLFYTTLQNHREQIFDGLSYSRIVLLKHQYRRWPIKYKCELTPLCPAHTFLFQLNKVNRKNVTH